MHVVAVARAVAFHDLLGFEVKDAHEHNNGAARLAALEGGDAQLTLARDGSDYHRTGGPPSTTSGRL